VIDRQATLELQAAEPRTVGLRKIDLWLVDRQTNPQGPVREEQSSDAPPVR
jgi:hypothetical protein